MERSEISAIAHRHHPIAAPLSAGRVRDLLSRVTVGPDARAVDLGCGRGEWLMALLALHGDLSGVGIDLHLSGDVQVAAAARGVGDRIKWVERDASTWSDGAFDVVMCVGATHAFGGLDGTLAAVRTHLRPGGQLVLGDGIWEQPPSDAAMAALDAGPDEFPALAGLVERVVTSGFEPITGHASTLEEWDDYEWSWTGSLIEWALREAPNDADRDAALEAAHSHRDAWLRGYRGELGFATLVLQDIGE